MLFRHLFGASRDATDRFRKLVDSAGAAASPAERAAAVSSAMGGMPLAEIEKQILSTYRRAYWGGGPGPARGKPWPRPCSAARAAPCE
jgi:hypothetical protein